MFCYTDGWVVPESAEVFIRRFFAGGFALPAALITRNENIDFPAYWFYLLSGIYFFLIM
jgi:hypothetical protein